MSSLHTDIDDVMIQLAEEVARLRAQVSAGQEHRNLRGLVEYHITSLPDVGGVRLKCKRDECPWRLEWPAHVEAPSMLHLTVQADIHTRREHGS